MRRGPLLLGLLGSLLTTAVAAAAPRDPVCAALDAVAERVRTGGQAEYISFIRLGPTQEEPMEGTGCGHKTGDILAKQFCDAALDHAGIEFSHRYPWLIKACLSPEQGVTVEESPWAYTGYVDRGRTDHLAGVLPNGVRVDVRYVPDTERDNPNDPKDRLNGYYGRYVMTLWVAP